MPVIVLKGKTKEYMFSVVEADYDNMPEWGGIYIAVRAEQNGIDIKNCLAMGSCSSFKEYRDKIRNFTKDKPCTHIYLLPEFKQQYRQLAINDLMSTEAFRDVFQQMYEETPLDYSIEQDTTQNQTL